MRYFLIQHAILADSVKHHESEHTARDFFNEQYQAYVSKHGHHFTERLAEDVCRTMENANGSTHKWSCEEVRNAMTSMDMQITTGSTIGDLTYSANMAYADFYPLVIKDAPSCVLYARAVATDPDGYEGIQFYRWLADVMAMGKKIDWQVYV